MVQYLSTVIKNLQVAPIKDVVDVATDLRALVGGAVSETVVALGAATAGDGGGALFRWTESGKNDDGANIFRPLDYRGNGRWERVVFGATTNISQWGVKGDGITDDRLAIQNALDAVSALGGGQIEWPQATYAISGPLVMRPRVSLLGMGLPKIVNTALAEDFFQATVLLPGNFHPAFVGVLSFLDCGTITLGNTVSLTNLADAATFTVGDSVIVASNEVYVSSGFNIFKYMFLNIVTAVNGSTLSLRYGIDKTFAGRVLRLDGTQLGRNNVSLSFWYDAFIKNFELSTVGYWCNDTATLNCVFENLVTTARGGIYGNSFQRTVFRKHRGQFSAAACEMSLCSLHSTVEDPHFIYVADPTVAKAESVSWQENARGLVLRNGRLDFGNATPLGQIVNFINAEANTIDGLQIVCGSSGFGNTVVQFSDATAIGRVPCARNQVRNLIWDGTLCGRYYTFTGNDDSGSVLDNTLVNSRFYGPVSSGECGHFTLTTGVNTARGNFFEHGTPVWGATTSGQIFELNNVIDGIPALADPDSYNRNTIKDITWAKSAARANLARSNLTIGSTSGASTLMLLDAEIGVNNLVQRDTIPVRVRGNLTGVADVKTVIIQFHDATTSSASVFMTTTISAATVGTFYFDASIYVGATNSLVCSGTRSLNNATIPFDIAITTDISGKDLSLQIITVCNNAADNMTFRRVQIGLEHPFYI